MEAETKKGGREGGRKKGVEREGGRKEEQELISYVGLQLQQERLIDDFDKNVIKY